MKKVLLYIFLVMIGLAIPLFCYRYGFIDGKEEGLKAYRGYIDFANECQTKLDKCEVWKPFYDVVPENQIIKSKRKT